MKFKKFHVSADRHQDDKTFNIQNFFKALTGLPRMLYIVWQASIPLTILMAFFTLLRGLLPLLTIITARFLLDGVIQAISYKTLGPIWIPVILQLCINLIDHFTSTMSLLVKNLIQDCTSNYIQSTILEKTNTLDLAFFENPKFYDQLRHASQDSMNKPIMMISQIFDLGCNIITLLSVLGLLLHLSLWLVIVSLIVPIPSFFAGSRFGLKNYWMLLSQSPEKRQQMYINTIMTVDDYNKEIKLFNLGNFFIKRYKKLGKKFYIENKRLQISHSLSNFLWASLSVISNTGLYLYVVFRAIHQFISIGELTQYTLAVNLAGQNFQGILDGISNMYEYSLYIDMFFTFMEYQPKIVSPKDAIPILTSKGSTGLEIEFRNVCFTYPEKTRPTLHNINFTIHSGETVALVGYNGAGKTTLVKLLTRLYDPDEGEILINGHNIKKYDLHDLRENIGVIFQDYIKYNLTAQENIGIGCVTEVENLSLIEDAARKSGADDFIIKLENKYSSMLGRWFDNGVQLSGGEWQKIALARAFLKKSYFLILDEPTSSLDAHAESNVFSQFRQITEGKTALFISHRFSTVRLANRIFVMENGSILEEGTHEKLIHENGRYAQMFNIQAKAYA